MQKCRNAAIQKCRNAEMQKRRNAEMQKSRHAEMQKRCALLWFLLALEGAAPPSPPTLAVPPSPPSRHARPLASTTRLAPAASSRMCSLIQFGKLPKASRQRCTPTSLHARWGNWFFWGSLFVPWTMYSSCSSLLWRVCALGNEIS